MSAPRRAVFILSALSLAGPTAGQAQLFDETAFSAWIGGGTNEFEERFPFSPQVALRLEGLPWQHVWIGADATASFVHEEESCVAAVGADCGDGLGLAVRPTISGLMRIEMGEQGARPYVAGTAGVNLARMSTMLGVGVGTRFPEAFLTHDLSLEARYRVDSRQFGRRYRHWELIAGVNAR
ncbi:MAG: hypothetical protein WEG36_01275 [Gemmatimonadota bacterium]